MSDSRPKTVTFDVGGTVYKVSRSLLEQHPDTMLARMVSETWENAMEPDKTLFLERDGDRFRYVLDYMRDGKVFLPAPKISKDALLLDLDYYGFSNVSPRNIQVSFVFSESVQYLKSFEKDCQEQLSETKRIRFAHYCASKYRDSLGGLSVTVNNSDSADEEELEACATASKHYNYSSRVHKLNEPLSKYGLKCIHVNQRDLCGKGKYCVEYTVKLEELA
mmetsp:Transcript_20028/g.41854  ORF Transcript_20028/g.41854 Transcript_20028/m.41854 type:complete len:220 (-) Transcript_20028:1029-1688(-)